MGLIFMGSLSLSESPGDGEFSAVGRPGPHPPASALALLLRIVFQGQEALLCAPLCRSPRQRSPEGSSESGRTGSPPSGRVPLIAFQKQLQLSLRGAPCLFLPPRPLLTRC